MPHEPFDRIAERTDAAVSTAWRAVDTASLMPADCLHQRHNRQALLEMRDMIDAALREPINREGGLT